MKQTTTTVLIRTFNLYMRQIYKKMQLLTYQYAFQRKIQFLKDKK